MYFGIRGCIGHFTPCSQNAGGLLNLDEGQMIASAVKFSTIPIVGNRGRQDL
jgi:hypothetical protein